MTHYKPLRDGLLLTTLREAQREALPTFYKDVFTEAYGEEDKYVDEWVADFIGPKHPTVQDEDVFVVIDPAQDGRIVSASMLVPQVWHYAGLPLPFGQIELVATHQDYRRRGLVRAAIEAAHARSHALGHLATGIVGIPFFYRQFGYSMSAKMGSNAALMLDTIPVPKSPPRYTLRRATEDDIPHLVRWYNDHAAGFLLNVARDAAYWRYHLDSTRSAEGRRHCFIVCDGDTPVGYVVLRNIVRISGGINCSEYVIGPEASYLATYNDVLGGLKQFVSRYEDFTHLGQPVNRMIFHHALHPIMQTLLNRIAGGWVREKDVYAWYMRVPDFEAFMEHIRPVLEQRLADSGARGYTGEIKINFYDQDGLTMAFEDGQLTTIRQAGLPFESETAAFPWHMFLNMVFGRHSYSDLSDFLPDAWANAESAVLLDILFPTQPVWIMQVD